MMEPLVDFVIGHTSGPRALTILVPWAVGRYSDVERRRDDHDPLLHRYSTFANERRTN
jgi:hypothetical protein